MAGISRTFDRKYIFKWWIFHCYLSLPECTLQTQNGWHLMIPVECQPNPKGVCRPKKRVKVTTSGALQSAETNSESTWKWAGPQKESSFQSSIFRRELLVSGSIVFEKICLLEGFPWEPLLKAAWFSAFWMVRLYNWSYLKTMGAPRCFVQLINLSPRSWSLNAFVEHLHLSNVLGVFVVSQPMGRKWELSFKWPLKEITHLQVEQLLSQWIVIRLW